MSFFMTVSLPRNPRYAATARLIAVQSAHDCGCEGAPAEAFAGNVEDAARKSLAVASGAKPHVMMAIERTSDALVVTIDSHVVELALT